MHWSDIAGQAAAVRFLRNALAAGRLPSLTLFTGPRGVGKRSAARVYAAAALCEAPSATAGPSPRDEACGSCRSCREFAAGVHADFLVPKVMDEKGGKGGKSGVRPLTDEDRMITLTKTVRPLVEDTRLRAARGFRRVAFVRRSERMNEEAQNTLLKSLEEPAGELVWVLTCDDPSGLLETVRSRATKVRFGRVQAELVARKLAEGLGGSEPLGEGRAREIASLSGGSFARAVEMIAHDWRAEREFAQSEVVPVLGAGARWGPDLARKLVARATSASRGGGAQASGRLEAARRAALRLVGVLARALGEGLRESVAAGPAESTPWAEGLKVALDTEAALRQNVRTELALTVAALRLARAGR